MKDESLEQILNDPLLRDYCPSERRAILVHRYFLGLEIERSPGLAEAIDSWEQRVAKGWRREKMRRDAEAQLFEIEKHKYFLSKQAGCDVGWDVAAHDWITQHAPAWRAWWEKLPESGA